MASLLFSAKATTYHYNNTYDMWRCETPFPQINKLLTANSQVGSFPIILTRPQPLTEIEMNNHGEPLRSASPVNKPNQNVQNDKKTEKSKKRKKTFKKPIHLGPCFFSHGCSCGHNV